MDDLKVPDWAFPDGVAQPLRPEPNSRYHDGPGSSARPVHNIWIVTGTVHTGLHFDDFANALTLIAGSKRVFLFPPSDSALLYPSATRT